MFTGISAGNLSLYPRGGSFPRFRGFIRAFSSPVPARQHIRPGISPLAARSRLAARATDAKIRLWRVKHRRVQTAAMGLCRGVYVFVGWVEPVLWSEMYLIIHAEISLRLFMDFSAGSLCISNRNITASQEKLYPTLHARHYPPHNSELPSRVYTTPD